MANIKFYKGTDTAAHKEAAKDGILFTTDTHAIYHNKVKFGDGNISSFPLEASQGGTGKTNLTDAGNAIMNALTLGNSDPQDSDYYICQWAGGNASSPNITSYHRRSMTALWNWVKKGAHVATTTSNGVLSKTDKAKIDKIDPIEAKVNNIAWVGSTLPSTLSDSSIYFIV